MNFLVAAHTDVGIRKNVNQDSLLVKVAQTNMGYVCLCVVCDGMGGLSSGELASATVIRAFEQWFENDFAEMLKKGFDPDELKLQWDNLIIEQNGRLGAYAGRTGTQMGTTVVALLIVAGRFYIMNVGDSRVYMADDELRLLTKDQSFVQYELDMGHITMAEAVNHPQRNVLLQCVGASETVEPDFYGDAALPDRTFILCSDGFRHIITPEEIYAQLKPSVLTSEAVMKEHAVNLVELNKQRQERDNISVIVVRTCREDGDNA